MSAPRLLVSLCTYNERENLRQLVPEIHRYAPAADVLVVDDNSPDETGKLADEMASADRRVRVLHRAGKQGLGTATLAAFRHAIDQNYDLLINMDADFSHHPRHIPELVAAMEAADVAVGSRYVPQGGIRGWSAGRRWMSRGINWYARLLLGLRTRDNSGSFRCYRVAKLREIDLGRFRSGGYSFFEEILYRCRGVECRFVEVPIIFEERRHGSSKINSREAATALWQIFRLGIDRAAGVPVRAEESQRRSASGP